MRLEREQELSFIEFNYQLLQSYDFLQLYKRHGCRLQIGGELAVLGRIHEVHAVSEDGDGVASRRQGRAVGSGVDAAGHSANDGKAGPSEVAGEAVGRRQTIGGGPPRADDTQHQRAQQLDATASEQRERRVEDLTKGLRIARVREGDELRAALTHLLLLEDGLVESAAARDALRHAARDAGRFELAACGGENGPWRAEALQQPGSRARAQAGDHFQSQPVQLFFRSEIRGKCSHFKKLCARRARNLSAGRTRRMILLT